MTKSRISLLLYFSVVLLFSISGPLSPGLRSEENSSKPAPKKKNFRILYLPCNENGGWYAHDLGGNHLHAKLFHPQWRKDPARRITLMFDGTRSWGRIRHSDIFAVNTLSIAVWLRPLSLPANTAVIAKRGKEDGFAFGLDERGRVYFSPSRDTVFWSNKTLEVGEWSHIAMSYNGKVCSFFVNGEEAGAVPYTSSLPVNAEAITLGVLGMPSAASPRYHGQMYDLRILACPVSAKATKSLVAHTSAKKSPKVFVVPIHGEIGETVPTDLLEKGIAAAQKAKANVLLLDIDSPGGFTHTARNMMDLLQNLRGMLTVTYVSGSRHKGAYSAAAAISLTTHVIIMRPSATIGAATAIIVDDKQGVKKAAPKFQAVWRAAVRAAAIAGGHAPALGDAMVESKSGVSLARIDGTPVFGTEAELAGMQRELGTLYVYEKPLAEEGQILALTGTDARQAGVIFATANTKEEALRLLGMADAKVIYFDQAKDIIARHAKDKEKTEKKAKELIKLFKSLGPLAKRIGRSRPDAQPYLSESGNAFRKQWRDATNRCLKACREYLKVVKKILAFNRKNKDWELDEHLDFDVLRRERDTVKRLKKQLEKYRTTATYIRLM